MADTRLMHAERLERLFLALAIAKLWCHRLGEQVFTNRESARQAIDPGPKCKLRVFQLSPLKLAPCPIRFTINV
jgi:hypothetical protein